MTIKLRKISRTLPSNPSQSKWYLTQKSDGSVNIKDIAGEIVQRSALSLGDVQSVLSNLVQIMPTFLKLGQSIRLEGFGTFRVTISSEGVDTPEELSTRQVKKVQISFLPSVELKQSLATVSFEIVAE